MSSNSHAVKRQEAVVEAFETYRGRLTAAIRRRVRDSAEADDVLQDVFVEYIDTYDLNAAIDVVIESVGAWLTRVAQNKILDRFRRRRTEQKFHEQTASGADTKSETTVRAPTPDEEFARSWLRKELVEAIARLPNEQRQVFVMHELEGKTFEEISALTGVRLNTLLARKRYAVLALREYLKEVYDELE